MRKLSELSHQAQEIATACIRTNLDTPTTVLSEVLNLKVTTVRTMRGNITRKLNERFNQAARA